MKRAVCLILMVVSLVVTCICGIKLYNEYHDDRVQEQQFEKILEFINEDTEIVDTDCSNHLDELYTKNNDFVGMIKIPNTNINYPVMESKNHPNYYLYRNFNKEYSRYGTPYIQENCELNESDNTIIYGHNMKTKQMFHDLTMYSSESFYESHKYIYITTKDKQYSYEIIATIKTVADSNSFNYSDFVNSSDETEFKNFVDKCKELSLYNIDCLAKYGDKLITLSTCEYSKDNGRFIVVAKRI